MKNVIFNTKFIFYVSLTNVAGTLVSMTLFIGELDFLQLQQVPSDL
jgi:hypothetical protein